MKHSILTVTVNVIALSLLGALFLIGTPFLVDVSFPHGILAAQPPQPAGQQQLEPPNTLDTAAALSADLPASDNWHIETVAHFDQEEGISELSLRLDGQGQPHIAYGSEHLYYAWYTDTAWYTQTVDAAPATGWDVSLALDSSGYAHIGYGSSNAGNFLKYAWYDGVNWNTEVVDMGDGLSLALDPGTGQPRISYHYADPQGRAGGLRYAWRDATGWHTETVQSGGVFSGLQPSLALDETGLPHISYNDNGNLKYAWREAAAGHDGTAWHIETVDSQWDVSGGPSLALDKAGRPHISYTDGYSPDYDLKYAWHDGNAWQIETVNSEVEVVQSTSLALDGPGYPHISYLGGYPNYNLQYAWCDATGWHTETVQSGGGFSGLDPSLALDGARRPHVSYSVDSDLKYAWRTSNLVLHKQIAPTSEVYADDSLTYILSLYSGVGSSVRVWDPLPDALHYVSGSLTSTLATPAVYSPTAHAIAWQGVLLTGTVGLIRFQATPQITGTDLFAQPSITNTAWLTDVESGQTISSTAAIKVIPPPLGEWHIETVDNQWGASAYTSLALDDSGRPHISYYNWHNSDLEYAAAETAGHDGSAWHVETVDSQGDVGAYTSLALDDSGRPHISYSGGYNNGLKYARREAVATETVGREAAGHDGSTWHVETVDSESAGWYTSLALDDAGRPHISYYGNSLKYARREAVATVSVGHDGNAWQIETVDSQGGVGICTSLALDGSGRPHISYFDGGNGNLKYAWREAAAHEAAAHEAAGHDGNAWQIEIIDSDGDSDGGTSLALDEMGRPHMSYNESNGNLKYAWREAAAAAGHDGTVWHIETVDYGGSSTSLALDEMGQPHVSYGDISNSDLKYAWYEPFLRLEVHTTPSNQVYNHEFLTYTLVLTGAGLNARLWDPLPDSLHYVTGSLSSNLATPAVYSPTAHAITWRGALPSSMPTDKLPEIQFQTVVDIPDGGSPFETPTIAHTAWLTDTNYGRVLSSTVTTRVKFPPLFLSKAAAPLDGLTNRDVVTYTLALSGTGQNAYLSDPLPMGVYYALGSLTSTLSPPAIYSPTARAITWVGVLPIDTVGLVRFQATRGITGPGSLNLSLPIVNTAWLTDTDNGTHVEATVIVNGYRLYIPLVLRGG